MSQVFVSYSRKDLPAVQQLVKRLKNDNIDAWIDKERIRPGQLWEDEIKKAIESSRAVILCFSSQWVDTEGYVQKEFRIVLDEAKRQPWGKIWMLPIALDADVVLPQPVKEYHYIHLNDDGGYDLLLDTLRDVVGTPDGDPVASKIAQPAPAFAQAFSDDVVRDSKPAATTWLDDLPLRFAKPETQAALDLLIAAYPTNYEALALAEDVGLSTSNLPQSAPVAQLMREILIQARRADLLKPLLASVLADSTRAGIHRSLRPLIPD